MAIGEIAPLNWAIRERWLELREELLFAGALDDIHARCEQARRRLAAAWQAAGTERRAQIAELLVELTIDMRSYLPRWHLPAEPALRATGVAAFEEQARANEELCRNWSEAAADRIAHESRALQRSSMRRVTELTDAGVLANRFGNDSPHGVTDALRRGAILVTTNPVMANNARRVEAAHWDPVRERLRLAAQAGDRAQRVMRFTLELVLDVARELRPIYRASGRRYGHVTYQVNPHRSDAADEMVAEAEQVWAWAAERLGGDPNVMFKVPGTEAGLAAAARLAGQGMPLTITASCSVAQHLAFGRVLEQAQAPCLLVQMNGRLDEPVAEELAANGTADGGRGVSGRAPGGCRRRFSTPTWCLAGRARPSSAAPTGCCTATTGGATPICWWRRCAGPGALPEHSRQGRSRSSSPPSRTRRRNMTGRRMRRLRSRIGRCRRRFSTCSRAARGSSAPTNRAA